MYLLSAISRMKIVVALVVLASCVVQIVFGYGNLDILRDGIARQKITVQNTVNRLRRYNTDFSYNLNKKLSNAKTTSMQEINSIVNPTLKTIEDATNKSTAEGKDAAQCYETARAGIREYSKTGFTDLENCSNDALSYISHDEVNIHSTILAAQQVLIFYDSIFPSCFTIETQQMETCIVGLLPEGTKLVQAFQTTTDNVISSSSLAASTAQVNAVNCNRGPISTVRQRASRVRLEANRCIAAL